MSSKPKPILEASTTPDALAKAMGWSPRRVREFARALGACRIMGNRVVLMPWDVVFILKASKPNLTIDEVKAWFAGDEAEIFAEQEAQGWAEPTGKVYFVSRSSEVKIGYTTDLDQRMAKLQAGSSEDFTVMLTVAGTPALERYFHKKFSDERIKREWFRLSGTIEEFIARRARTLWGSPP